MSKYSISNFVEQTKNVERGEGMFELETERMIELNLDGSVGTKTGSMIA